MATTGPDSAGLVLVYDGGCGFCEATSRWLVRKGAVDEARRQPFQTFEGEAAARLREAGVRNELAVLDPHNGEVRTGFLGLLWLARESPLRRRVRWVDWPPLRNILALCYRVVSYNRRIIAPIPPAQAAACDCDPDPHPAYRAVFVLLLLAFAAVGWAAFTWAASLGQSLFGERVFEHGARVGLLAFALGWGPSLLLAAVAAKRDGGALVAHVAYLVGAGGAILLPASSPLILASHLSAPAWVRVALLVVTLPSALVFLWVMADRRCRILEWSRGLAGIGVALLVGGTLVAVVPVL
ncbi:MAG: DCC1-like thiol-disulfide oxidoreductase family protein [Planctomycetota bacterium]